MRFAVGSKSLSISIAAGFLRLLTATNLSNSSELSSESDEMICTLLVEAARFRVVDIFVFAR